ncbi:MAG: DUF4347 domain-containing protein [Paucimonas sp.]|jgi:methionine-rich copper-binding protein CopC|nr:DUF4347 domain-containing protein [Paucimonas sp.]
MKFIERFSRKPAPQTVPADPGAAPMLMALEPRIMFDASVGVVAQEAAQATAEPAKDSTSTQDQASQAPATADTSATATQQRHEVVFVDGQLNNVQDLLSGLSANAEVVVLDPSRDGLQQMADYLKGREGLDAIQLLSHGADGTVQAGTVWLSEANLAQHRAALESIGAALKADGDLMLYGCRVGEGDKGQSFIDELASITGADVAASSDDTGGTAQGGNWVLERTSGSIETASLGAQLSGYQGLMVAAFTGGPDASSPSFGALSYINRMVVGDFNNDGRDDILYQSSDNLWRFAAGNANGTFTISAQGSSPFASLTLADNAASGNLYYVGDFDGDGDDDVLYAAPSSATHTFYRNNNDGTFTALPQGLTGFTGSTNGQRLIVGDFNGDGATDILFQVGSTGTAWKYALNNGSGSFTEMDQGSSPFAGVTLLENNVFGYRVVDFDGDGDLDIYAGLNAATGKFYRNDGGTFSDQTASLTNLPALPNSQKLLLGDFDGDGDADMFFQNGADGTAWRYFRNDNGTFVELAQSASPFAGMSMLNYSRQNYRLGDFDGDGDYDVFGSMSSGVGSTYLMSGAPPKLVSATPADNSNNVSPSANIVLTFSESVTKGVGNIYIVRTSDNTIMQTIDVTSSQVTGSGTTWTIDPSNLAQGTAYAVRIDTKTFVDADGVIYRGIQNNTTLNFTTATVQAPVIANLHGDSVNYTEDAAFTLLDLNSNATVSDADSSNFNGGKLTVQVTAGGTAGEDVLFIRNEGNGANEIEVDGLSIKYNGLEIGTYTGGTSGAALVITLTSNANATTTEALVHNLAYRNSNTTQPSTTTRSVSISMDDGAGGNSTVSVVNLAVLSVNDAPVVNSTGTNPTYTENGSAVVLFSGTTINTVETGQFIKQMMFTVTGLLDGSQERLTIDGTQVNLVSGTNVVTLNNSTTVTVSLNNGTALVTLTHSGLASATAQTIVNNMTYNNASEGPSGSSRVVTLFTVTDTGGVANAGADATAPGITSTVTLVSINDAPTLSGGPYVMTPVNEETVTTSYQVSSILGSMTYGDLDPGYLSGIAVTSTVGRGTWQYSTDGSTWTDFGAVLSTSSLLLSSTTQVRYVPDAANGENVSMTFRAWDRTSGTASTSGVRSTADTTSNGGSTAFSTGTAQATLAVSSVNDAPVMIGVAPTLGGLTDTSINNGGSLVSDLLGGVTDVDTGALKGMAITAVTAEHGKWQYSTNAGSTWSDIGSVSVTSALILTAQNMVRFVPDGIHGETATITYKAWDQTNATFGLQGTKTNTTTSGGTSAYSSQEDTATVVVTAVNERPVVTLTGTAAIWTEANNAPSDRIAVDSGVTVSDPDGPNPLSATVRLLTYYSAEDSLAFVNDGLSMGNIVGTWNAGTGTLTLESAGNLATAAEFQAAMRAVTYGNSSDTPNTISRTIEFQITDGGNMASIAVTRDVTIVAVNDSPTISAPVLQSIDEDIPTALGSITFSDADSTLGIVTFSLVGGTGTLSATGAGGVTVGGTSTLLTLSGTLANINQFIANNRLVYTSPANASGDVTLTINVNTTSVSDATTTMTLRVQAVNDAPVATVPPSITVTEDVSSVITGISFTDIDVGINAVTATFSVPSGTLSATTGLGVTVGGSGTGLLTLTGSLADINFFIAANGLTFKTAQDATASVILTVNINDGGFSGSGGEQTDTKTVTLNVTAVNDAPVNNVPGAQTASQNVALGFNTANGNAISISDVDSGNGLMSVTLTAVNGTLSLGSLTGINMANGTGQNSITMTIEGNRTNINAALQTLTFKATNNYLGAASVTIETNDNGNSGTGGAKSDVDTISINVIPVNPKVTNVSAQGLDRTVKIGDEVLISMTWDQVVNVDLSSGSPSLLLETGLVDRNAVYVSGTGSNTLVFKYTVQAGDISADLDFQSTAALQLNGAVISNNTSDLAVLTLPTVGGSDSLGGRSNIVVDGVVPVVGSVSAPTNGTYITGQGLDFTVNFNEAMTVDTTTGMPRIAVTLDTGGTVYAEYVSGSGSSALVFRMVVASGQLDSNGITLGSSIDTNGGAITDLAGNATVTTLNSVASTTGVNVDGIAPSVVSVVPPVDGSYKAGDVLTFTVNANEAVQIGSLAPRLVLDVGGVTRYATYLSGSGSGALVFQYVVQAGDNDANGIALSSIDLRGEQLTDLAGNDIDLTLNGVGNMAGVRVDTTAPNALGIATIGAPLSNGSTLSYTVTFNEDVLGVDTTDFSLANTGSVLGSITGVTRVDARTYTVTVSNVSGDGTLGLNIQSGAQITDLAGNALSSGLTGDVYTVDHSAPSAILVTPPSNGHTYVAGENIDISVKLSEVVYVNGDPQLGVIVHSLGGIIISVPAHYLSGSGTDTLVFRMTVTEPMHDNDGIVINSFINLMPGTIRDAAGNDASNVLPSVGLQTGVRVDAVVPEVASVSVPAAGGYKAGDVLSFTVNASEPVLVDTSTGTPRLALTIGGVTRYADYVSGNGSGALTFHYIVQGGDNGNGISVAGSLDLNGGTVKDAAGNAIKLPLNNLGNTSSVNVDTAVPTISGFTQLDATANNNASVRYSLSFSEVVSGVDASDFNLLFNGTANGSIESITTTDGRNYVITVGGLSGVGQVRLDLKAGTDIGDASGNLVASGQLGGSYSIDRIAPSVASVSVPANGTYMAGQHLDFTVTLDEDVLLSSNGQPPSIEVNLGNGQTALALFQGQAGNRTLVFRLTVAQGQLDTDGITLGSSINLNGAVLRDAVGNDANLTLNNVGDTSGINVDAVAPVVSSVTLPPSVAYNAGDVLTFTVNTSENVNVDTSSGTPRLALNIGGVTRYASYVAGNGTSTLVFQYTVQAGNNATAGVGLPGSIDLNGSTLRDAAGNDMNLQLNAPGTATGVIIDTVAPQVGDIVRVDVTPTNAGSLRYTVTFDESVNGVDSADFALAVTGSASGRIASVTRIDGRTYQVLVDNLSGAGNVRLDLKASNTGIVDVAGNPLTGGLEGSTYTIDRVAPSVTAIEVNTPVLPTDRSLSFTLTFDKAVSGVDASDFSVVGTSTATGVVQSVQRIDAQTYRIVVGDLRGQGTLALGLNALNSGIQDGLGNLLTQSRASTGQSVQAQDVGDLEYRVNPPDTSNAPQTSVIQPQVPGLVINESISPLVVGSLFEVRTVGGDLKPLGTIFLGQAGSAPSFIAQVFGSSDTGLGGGDGQGFLGFGGGNGGIFGGSTFATIFGREVPGVTEMNVFSGSQWKQSDLNQGLRGVFGVPTFGQQLQQINEADQRHVRELAKALAKPAEIGQRA